VANVAQGVNVAAAGDVPGFAVGKACWQDFGQRGFGIGAAHVVAVGAFLRDGAAGFLNVGGALACGCCHHGGVEAGEKVV
jgi:hypothetical protein